MEGMEDQRYSRLGGNDEQLGILTFSGNDKRSKILKVRWNG